MRRSSEGVQIIRNHPENASRAYSPTLYVAIFSFIAFTFVGKVFILRGLWVKATSCRVSSKVLPEVKAKGAVAFTRKRLSFRRLQRMVKE